MINTTLAVLALAVGLDLGNPPSLKWTSDYAAAMSRASAAHKPMAVFIGHGDNAERMVAEGTITADAAKLLASHYVCVYLNTETPNGKDLSGQFELSQGLVISGPGGSKQAYRHTGMVPAATLTQELTRFASAEEPTTTVSAGLGTLSNGVVPAVYSGMSGGCPNGRCPNAAPGGQYIVPAGYSYPGTSSCPNGRCPNAR